jgi:hypothetical protein
MSDLTPDQLEQLAYDHFPKRIDRAVQFAHAFGWLAGAIRRGGYDIVQLQAISSGLYRGLTARPAIAPDWTTRASSDAEAAGFAAGQPGEAGAAVELHAGSAICQRCLSEMAERDRSYDQV